jgi:hypothetical protein
VLLNEIRSEPIREVIESDESDVRDERPIPRSATRPHRTLKNPVGEET